MTDPVVAPKNTPKAITIKHLAYELAEQHKLRYAGTNIQSISNKLALVLMEDLFELITAHLKKGERVKLAGLGIWVVRPRGPQSGDWRAHQYQGQQKSSLPRQQRTQDGDLIAKFPMPRNGAIIFSDLIGKLADAAGPQRAAGSAADGMTTSTMCGKSDTVGYTAMSPEPFKGSYGAKKLLFPHRARVDSCQSYFRVLRFR